MRRGQTGEKKNDSDSASGEATENEKRTEKKKKNGKRKQPVQPHVYRWRKAEPPQVDKNFYGNDYSLPPENVDQLTPIDYFEMFWKEDLNELISEQTNLYSVQSLARVSTLRPKKLSNSLEYKCKCLSSSYHVMICIGRVKLRSLVSVK